jgi:hypothetical protein
MLICSLDHKVFKVKNHCSLDSDLSFQLDTKVVSAKPSKLTITRDGKKLSVSGFEVVYEDTILFPEGGGQVLWVCP